MQLLFGFFCRDGGHSDLLIIRTVGKINAQVTGVGGLHAVQLCAGAKAEGQHIHAGSSARKVMAYEALMRSDMEALRSPATIMKLAQEQGALYEIERLTFFKSLETFAHPRSMQIIAEGVETAAELRKVIELGADALQGYFLAKPAAVPAKMAPAARKVIAEYSSASDSG